MFWDFPLAEGILYILSLGLSFPFVKRLSGIKQCIVDGSTSCYVCCLLCLGGSVVWEGGSSASLLIPGGWGCWVPTELASQAINPRRAICPVCLFGLKREIPLSAWISVTPPEEWFSRPSPLS